MTKPDRSSRVIRLAEAQRSIPGPAGEHAVVVFRRGPLDVALSLPLRPSQQAPHLQDEIYFIVRGRGVLLQDGKRDQFESGDLLFVAAGVEHQNRGDFREFCDVACILRPTRRRSASIERVAGILSAMAWLRLSARRCSHLGIGGAVVC